MAIKIKYNFFWMGIWVLGLLFFGSNEAQAIWIFNGNSNAGMGASGLDSSVETIRQETQNLILSRMKQDALKQVRETVAGLVTGSQSGEPMFVTDYYDYIYGQPMQNARTEMNQIFRELERGASAGEREMIWNVENQLKNELFPETTGLTLGKIVSTDNPLDNLFLDGTMDGFNELYSGINHPSALKEAVRSQILSYIQREEDIRRTSLIVNQGFQPQNGLPGRLIGDMISKSQEAPIEMITNATSMEQVQTNLSTSMISAFLKTGYEAFAQPGANQAINIQKRNTDIQRLIYEGQTKELKD